MLVLLIGCQRISMPKYVLYQFWPRLTARAWNVWIVSENKTSMGKTYAINVWCYWEHFGNALSRTFIYNTWANHWPINSTECETRVTIVWKGVCPCKTFTYFVKFLHGQNPFSQYCDSCLILKWLLPLCFYKTWLERNLKVHFPFLTINAKVWDPQWRNYLYIYIYNIYIYNFYFKILKLIN